MNILIAAPGFDARAAHGVNIFALDQAKALKSAGHDVRLAAVDTRSIRRTRPFGFFGYELEGIPVFYGSVPCGRLPLGIPELAGRLAASGIWQAAVKDGWTPDIIHQHFGTDFASLSKREHIPFVFTEHASWHNRLMPPAEAEHLKESYGACAAVLAVSRSLAENMYRNTGVKAQILPNIVDTSVFSRKRIVHCGFSFVTAGNMIPTKKFDLLLRSFAKLGKEARLTVFGDGKERGSLEALAGGLGIENRVTFRGNCPREQLAEAYAEADCFVLASESETFGVVYIEAMAAGLPVIATSCGGPEDFVTEKNGILIPVDDEKALTDAMEHMMLHRDGYDSAAIAEEAQKQFAPEAIAARLTEIYRALIK